MLVLSRKKGERIMIGDKIVITVLEVKGDRVRLGIEAPDDVGIWRQEIYEVPIAAVPDIPPEDPSDSGTPKGE